MRRFVSAFTLLGVCVSALGCSSPDPGSAPSDMGGVADAAMEDMSFTASDASKDNADMDLGGEDADMTREPDFEGEYLPPGRLPELDGLPDVLMTRAGYPVTSSLEWERVRRAEVFGLLEKATSRENLVVCGLMTIPPFEHDPEVNRRNFKELAALLEPCREWLRERGLLEKHPFEQISMGMSGDFEIAIEEGATLVRVGSAIFGNRTYSD